MSTGIYTRKSRGYYSNMDRSTTEGFDAKLLSLFLNDEIIATGAYNTINIPNIPKGITIVEKSLYIDGTIVAKSTLDNPTLHYNDNGLLYFGDVQLQDDGNGIDISLNNYRQIISGSSIPNGCRRWNPLIQYNVISNYNTYEESALTFTTTDHPMISVWYFDPIISVGLHIKFDYYVDTYNMDGYHDGVINLTFTVYVKDANNNELYTRNCYAGAGHCDILLDMPNNTDTYISVQVVDNRGVASPIQYFDVLIKNLDEENLLDVTPEILQDCGIDSNLQDRPEDRWAAYNNKAGFTLLFNRAVSGYYNNTEYNGVKLYNSGNTVYYMDFHTLLPGDNSAHSTSEDFDLVFETMPDFYKVSVTVHKNVTSNGTEYVVKYSSVEPTTYSDIKNSLCTVWWTNPKNLRTTYQPSGAVPTVTGDVLSSSLKSNAIDTGILDLDISIINGTPIIIVVPKSKSGSHTIFPDNFTLDLNNATIKSIKCNDFATGVLLRLYNNFNVHIKNGTIEGSYTKFDYADLEHPENYSLLDYDNYIQNGGFDWVGCLVKRGSFYGPENLATFDIYGSKYCSCDNVIFKHNLGYGGTSRISSGDRIGSVTTGTYYNSNRSGYTDYRGNFVSNSNLRLLGPYSLTLNIIDNGSVSFGTRWLNYRAGQHLYMFYHFYNNDTFISTVKSHLHYMVRIPLGANKVYITICGSLGTYWNDTDSNGDYVTGVKDINGFKFCSGIEFNSCQFLETKSTPINPSGTLKTAYKNCYFESIGMENIFGVTSMLADFEEGYATLENCAFINCVHKRGFSKGGINAYNRALINYCRNLTFVNNTIDFKFCGGIGSALVYNNSMHSPKIEISLKYNHPHIIYLNNVWMFAPNNDIAIKTSKSDVKYLEEINTDIRMVDSSIVSIKNGSNLNAGVGKAELLKKIKFENSVLIGELALNLNVIP